VGPSPTFSGGGQKAEYFTVVAVGLVKSYSALTVFFSKRQIRSPLNLAWIPYFGPEIVGSFSHVRQVAPKYKKSRWDARQHL